MLEIVLKYQQFTSNYALLFHYLQSYTVTYSKKIMSKFESRGFTWLIITVIIIWIISGIAIWHIFPSLEERSHFGDMFGAVNALFSGLALAGVIYTIYLQRNELKLQRDELRLQREEVSKMASGQIRHLHISLLTLAIEKDELSEVWTGKGNEKPSFSQRTYANLILSHWEMMYSEGLLSPEQTKILLIKYFKRSRYFRILWEETFEFREAMASLGDKSRKDFVKYANESYQEATNSSTTSDQPEGLV